MAGTHDVPPQAAPDQPAPDQLRSWLSRRLTWLLSGTWAAMAWGGLALAALVGLWQTSSIVQELTPQGQYSVLGLYGPGQVASFATPPITTFGAWEQAAMTFGKLYGWLWYCLAFDAALIVSLGALASVILRRYSRSAPSVWLTSLALGGFAVEAMVGAVCLLVRPHGAALTVLAWVLHLSTIVAWVLATILLTWVAYRVHASRQLYKARVHQRAPEDDLSDETGIYADLRRLWNALEVQRFSLVVVVLLALIAIGPPLSDTLEQLPDVQRAWLNAGSLTGLQQMSVALVTELLIAYLLFRLGRMRKRRADVKFARTQQAPGEAAKRQLHLPWLIIPAVVGLLAWLLRATDLAHVSWPRLFAFAGTILLIYMTSAVLDLRWGDRISRGRNLPPPEYVISDAARVAGDALAFAVLAVTPIGLVRSLTAEVLAVPDPGWEPVATFWVAMLAALALPLAGPPALRRMASRRHSDLAGPTVGLAIAMVPFMVADVLLIWAPFSVAPWLGPLATAEIAIGTLAGLLGALAYLAQMNRPLAIFGLLKMNVTPVITIVLIVAAVGGIVDRNSALHQVRLPIAGRPAPRLTIAEALAAWRGRVPASCALPAGVADGHEISVIPLIQVAASGGGIRAAWWTVRVLGTVADSRCGASDVFAVSSVSGGSVGTAVLATARGTGTQPGATANARVATMATPAALSAGIDGFLLRDALAGFTGIEAAAAGTPPSDRYPDRAALIELEWQREDAGLSTPFPPRDPAVPWAMLFNSTSVSTGCRAVISTVTLPRQPQIPGMGLTCGVGTRGPSGSYDFLARLRCMQGLATSTAAMLSARFTYVTPTGTVNGCDRQRGTFDDQLVDGGYGDSTGLSTLVNLAPVLMSHIRAQNIRAIAAAKSGEPITLVVPVTVYLQNSLQRAPVAVPPSRAPEFYAPTVALSAGPQTELRSPDSLLAGMLAATSPDQWINCQGMLAICASAVSSARTQVPDQLITVAPREYPGVSVPLGWLLSRVSQEALDGALARDIDSPACVPGAAGDPYCLPGLGGMADLLRLIRLSPRQAARSVRG
ncbi:MAG TPA: hypothetical protein VF162_09595 [Streptosporangiaceae bacterium]